MDGKDLILIADDEADIVRLLEANLQTEGFETTTASDGEQTLQAAYDQLPDLILLDVMMPKVDGVEVCQRLRADPRTKNISVIMLTARSLSADKVLGLTAGADDYMIKPFDRLELIARVRTALRRSREMRSVNPLTQLPGNIQVQQEVRARVESGTPFALMYVDLDDFKAFNDHYGFLRGDEAIKTEAQCLHDATAGTLGNGGFVGHIGGDDFVVIVDADRAEEVAREIIRLWDAAVGDLYDPADLERGYIEVVDRQKRLHRFEKCTISIGIATNSERPIASHWEASEIASEMKSFAKRERGSSYALDRRTKLADSGQLSLDGDPAPPISPDTDLTR